MNIDHPNDDGIAQISAVLAQAEEFQAPPPKRKKSEKSSKNDEKDPTQVEILLEISEAVALFHDRDGVAYADLEEDSLRRTWPVKSQDFKDWLLFRYFQARGSAPNGEALSAAINTIIAKAKFEGPQHAVFMRSAEFKSTLYIDLADEQWRVVEIDAEGWRIIQKPPIRFRRTDGMQALPVPQAGGSIDLLRPFLNVKSNDEFVLAVAWLLGALRPLGPYPILSLAGEQGSSKSTFSLFMRLLVDPNAAPLRSLPREIRDLYISGKNAHVLAFDNLSGLPSWISDGLCRMATGGGFAVRGLYSDDRETIFEAMRPIIMNGIGDMVERADLADRALVLTLEAIPEDKRQPASELMASFQAVRPAILGALFDGIVEGLRRHSDIRLQRLPRMADFAKWATACETAFWPIGSFAAAYDGNQQKAVADVLEADLIANAVSQFMADRTGWEGTASDLLSVLSDVVGDRATRSRGWPDSARALSGQLRRAATFLRKTGIEVTFIRQGHGGSRIIRLTVKMPPREPPTAPSGASASSAPLASTESLTFSGPAALTQADDMHFRALPTVSDKALSGQHNDAADAADGEIPLVTSPGAQPSRVLVGSRAFGTEGPMLWGDEFDQLKIDMWLERHAKQNDAHPKERNAMQEIQKNSGGQSESR